MTPLLDHLTRLPLRIAARSAHAVLKAGWAVRNPRVRGAHAVALTPAGDIVLVKLRYARGWRLPGGGVDPGEDVRTAALRELREEIGLTAYGAVEPALEEEDRFDFKRDRSAIFIVRDVAYTPSWSWEVEAVAAFSLRQLPPDLSPRTARWLTRLDGHLAPFAEERR